MQVLILPNPEAVAQKAADHVQQLLQRKPDAVLALPTGNTPLKMYAEFRNRQLDWRRATTFNLDEYVGIPMGHPGSYHTYMRENFLQHVNLPHTSCHVPDGQAQDLDKACQDYEDAIHDKGGLDLAILGIGQDGHLAFNEPPSSIYCRTRVVRLAPSTRQVNSAVFGALPPERAVTMGIGTLLQARCMMLLATGESKAAILKQAVEGPLTAFVPASALQLHPQPIILADEAAAGALELQQYYREAYGP